MSQLTADHLANWATRQRSSVAFPILMRHDDCYLEQDSGATTLRCFYPHGIRRGIVSIDLLESPARHSRDDRFLVVVGRQKGSSILSPECPCQGVCVCSLGVPLNTPRVLPGPRSIQQNDSRLCISLSIFGLKSASWIDNSSKQ